MIRERKDAGAALLSILLIVAALSVAALIATSAIAQQTDLHKIDSRKSMALWAARSAEAVAAAGAADLVRASRLPASEVAQERQMQMALPMKAGSVTLAIGELPPCLNLNALGDLDPLAQQAAADGFYILLQDIGVPDHDAARAVAVLSDWIDADSETRPLGAENAAYLAQSNTHRAANQRLASLNDLAAIPEFPPSLRQALEPFACVLPSTEMAPLNANALTAFSAPVLRAATGGRLSLAEARRFADYRPPAGWEDAFSVRSTFEGRPSYETALAGVPLSVRGQYFEATGSATYDAGQWGFRFLMRADEAGPAAVVWREFGGAG